MRTHPLIFWIFCLLLLTTSLVKGQNVSISETESYTPDPSAMLDVYSQDKGILIPRLSTAQRMAIISPANGLMVFDTVYNCFFYYFDNGIKAGWTNLSSYGPASNSNFDEALFAVVNSNGDTVFAVYQEGVQINVADGLGKAAKGGFAVSGISAGKGIGNEYFRVSPDSVRIYVESGVKGAKGGFAVSGVSAGKGIGNDILRVTEDSVRVYFNSTSTKAAKGGFAVSGVSAGKGTEQSYLTVNQDSVRIYVENGAKGAKGGFAVSGVSAGKGSSNDIMKVTQDSTRIYVANPEAGFSIGNTETGTAQSLMKLTKENYFIGHEAGIKNTLGAGDEGRYNSFIGYQAGKWATTGYRNVLLGYQAGLSLQEGFNNVFIGYKSGYWVINAINNVFIGTDVGGYSTGSRNIFIGDSVGHSNQSGEDNVFLGFASGASNTTGHHNVFLGSNSAVSNIYGFDNVMIGANSGFKNTNGNSNVFLGDRVGYNNINGNNNVVIGHLAGYKGNADNNVFIGDSVGYENYSGMNNVFMGFNAGKNNSDGSDNVLIGTNAGYKNTSGLYNVMIGSSVGYSNSSGNFNVFLGNFSGKNNISGSSNTFIGYSCGYKNDIGSNNVFLGRLSGYENTTGYSNVFIGDEAGHYNTLGYYNVFMGYQAGLNADSAYYNTFVGAEAGQNTKNGTSPIQQGKFNSFFGTKAGAMNTTGYYNSFFGNGAGWNSSTGARNTFLGNNSGYQNSGGNENTFVGNTAGYNHRNGDLNTYIGARAGYYSYTAATRNIALGAYAGYGNSGGLIGADNISIGSESGYNLLGGNSNINIGYQTGHAFTSASNNICIGYQAGLTLATSNNILIGYQATSSDNYFANIVAIGNGVSATGPDQVRLGNASTSTLFCQGAYASTTAIAPNLYVNSSGQIVRSTATIAVGSGTANTLAFWSDANTLSSNSLLYWNNTYNRLGIGNSVPYYPLDIAGGTGIRIKTNSNSTDQQSLINFAVTTTNPADQTYSSYIGGIRTAAAQELIFGTTSTVSGSPVEKMRIDGSGNVGIGYSLPDAKLFVEGDAGSDALRVRIGGSTKLWLQSNGATSIGSATAGPANGLYVNGRVGIGMSSPNSRLHINSVAGEDGLNVQINSATKFWVQSNGSTSIGAATAGPANGLFVSGNTGIGTASPDYGLHIYKSDFEKAVFENNGTAYKGYIGNDVSGLFLSTNAYYNGSAWNSDVTTSASLIFAEHVANSQFEFRVKPASGAFSTAMVIETTGNVGIGTTAPSAKLEITGDGTPTQPQLELTETGSGDGARILFKNSNATTNNWTLYGAVDANSPSSYFHIYYSAVGIGDILNINGNGNVGIKRNPTANRFEVEGDASKTTASGWAANSDKRIKTDITDINNSFETILKLHPVKFKYTEEWKKRNPSIEDKYYYNFIAQEYQEVFPESVKGSGEYLEGDDSVILQLDSYNAQIVTIKAVQELIIKSEDQQKQIEALQEENSALKSIQKNYEELKTEIEMIKASIQMK